MNHPTNQPTNQLNTDLKNLGAELPAPCLASAARVSTDRKIDAGQAVSLRAEQPSVLRITHGRVWLTLSETSPCSPVLAGDHFLSQGQSLTLLAGQALVMESFPSSASKHPATAHFSWETPGLVTSATADAKPAHQALGLVASACSRLVQGLSHGAATFSVRLAPLLARFFGTKGACNFRVNESFDMPKKHQAVPTSPCSAP